MVGYIYIYPSQFGVCESGGYCTDRITHIGEPTFTYSKWLLITAFILLFVRDAIIRRWSFFAVPYLLISMILIAMAPVSPFWGKDAIANLLGMVFVAVSLLWIGVHVLLIRRHEKQK